jgi:hypothetical protein
LQQQNHGSDSFVVAPGVFLLPAIPEHGGAAGMEAVKSLLKPKPTPQQQLREWQRRLRNEGRNIERQIRGPPLPLFDLH